MNLVPEPNDDWLALKPLRLLLDLCYIRLNLKKEYLSSSNIVRGENHKQEKKGRMEGKKGRVKKKKKKREIKTFFQKLPLIVRIV